MLKLVFNFVRFSISSLGEVCFPICKFCEPIILIFNPLVSNLEVKYDFNCKTDINITILKKLLWIATNIVIDNDRLALILTAYC